MDEQPEEKDDQPHRKWGRGQNLLLVLLIIAVMAVGLIYSLWGEIFPSRPVTHITPTVAPSATIDARLAGLHLPAGFHISIFEAGLNTPRFMTFGPDRTLFVAERGTNSIIALLDPHHTGRATEKRVLHGSFYRDFPAGYKVIFIPLNAQGQIAGPAQDFISGWLVHNNTSAATGRPVGLTVGPDGALYISDDKGGVIYRVTYGS